MKKYSKAICRMTLLLFVVLFSNASKATHFAAADIYAKYVGIGVDPCSGLRDYKYEITLDVYKACEPGNASLGATENIRIRSANAAFDNTINVPVSSIDTLDELCDAFKSQNSCRVPASSNLPGFVRHRYILTITLASAQSDWIFSWRNGNRNSNIVNLVNANTAQLYVEAGLDNSTKNNSTPRYLVSPIPYICVNQPAIFLNGPYDEDGDSLNVTNVQPLDNIGTPINYSVNYSLSNPVASAGNNPYNVNKNTGTATFTPTGQGYYVVAFLCEEYDKATGARTGYVIRDAQISVLNCSAPPPSVDSIPLQIKDATFVNNALLVCPGSNLNFSVESKSTNPGNQLYMEANNAIIPGSSFTTAGSGTASITGTFDWTPTTADIGEHTLIITAKDSTCSGTSGLSIVLKNYSVILIRVLQGLDAGKDLPFCALNPTPKQLYVRGAEMLNTIKWTDISGGAAKNLSADNVINPIATPQSTTEYVVSTPDLAGNCKNQDTVSVYIDNSSGVDIFPQVEDFVMCKPGYLQLDMKLTGKDPLINMPCGPSTNPNTKLDSFTVYGSSVFGTGFSYDTLGSSTPVLYNNVRTAKMQFLILSSEFKEYGIASSTLRSLAFETVKSTTPNSFVYKNFTISLKCTEKKELDKNIGFETGVVPVYTATSNTSFPDGFHKFNFDVPYNIDMNKNLIVQICYSDNPDTVASCTSLNGTPPIIKFNPVTYSAGLVYRPVNGSVKDVCNATIVNNIAEIESRPTFSFDYNEAPSGGFAFIWHSDAYLSDSTIKQPLAYVSKSSSVVLQTFGRSGCKLADTLNVIVPQHDFYVLPKDTAICFGETSKATVKNGTYYQWFEYENGQFKSAHESVSCEYCAIPILKPKKTTHYKIKVGDELFCYDTIDAYVEVKANPIVNILNKDTVIKYGQSIQLMVNGARIYNWTPVSSLNNPNVSYPIAKPTESTMYVVAGIASNGCVAYDTLRVGINYRDNLLIPTAFSPNGDGRNDLFRIANMTTQRYLEFRVFNRWGQEVYNGNNGWDGKWRGVAQESGAYTYLIRVAYPDGEVETYRGDVTLVR